MGGRAVVVGAGLTGRAVRKHLEAHGYQVDVIDDAAGPVPDEVVEEIVEGAELMYPSAGVPPRHPAWKAAATHDVPVVGELDLAQRVRDVPVVAVTASNGKTTITTLVAEMLQRSGRRALAAGNIGYPLIEAVGTDAEVIVAEVSSFQLHAAKEFRAAVALWANVSPNHLDWHGTYEEYLAAKARIFRNQGRDDHAVVNADDPAVMAAVKGSPARVVTFGAAGTFRMEGDTLVHAEPGAPPVPLVGAGELPRSLPHDIANALAALATAHCAGADLGRAVDVLREFTGLPHRVELVGEAGGVRWFNDSKATTPEAVRAAAGGFESVILIAGGRNKGVDLAAMVPETPNVRAVVAIGEAAEEVEAAFSPTTAVARAQSMADAVTRAACLARSGDVVLLSPGCASFDWYGSYAERGDDFRRLVDDVIGRSRG